MLANNRIRCPFIGRATNQIRSAYDSIVRVYSCIAAADEEESESMHKSSRANVSHAIGSSRIYDYMGISHRDRPNQAREEEKV